MPSDRLEGVALVTGGGRGIGASIARELADAGMRVAVTGRTAATIEAVAAEIGGLALEGDVTQMDDVEHWMSSDRSTSSSAMRGSQGAASPSSRSIRASGGMSSA